MYEDEPPGPLPVIGKVGTAPFNERKQSKGDSVCSPMSRYSMGQLRRWALVVVALSAVGGLVAVAQISFGGSDCVANCANQDSELGDAYFTCLDSCPGSGAMKVPIVVWSVVGKPAKTRQVQKSIHQAQIINQLRTVSATPTEITFAIREFLLAHWDYAIRTRFVEPMAIAILSEAATSWQSDPLAQSALTDLVVEFSEEESFSILSPVGRVGVLSLNRYLTSPEDSSSLYWFSDSYGITPEFDAFHAALQGSGPLPILIPAEEGVAR